MSSGQRRKTENLEIVLPLMSQTCSPYPGCLDTDEDWRGVDDDRKKNDNSDCNAEDDCLDNRSIMICSGRETCQIMARM